MGTKAEPGAFDCHASAADDEPIFTLLARDATAPEIIEMWASFRAMDITWGKCLQSDWSKVTEARECADAMRKWRKANRAE